MRNTILTLNNILTLDSILIIEEETDRREGKGHRCMLFEGRNSFHSTPHNRFSTRMIWRKWLIEEWTLGRMDASVKWMIIWFTPYQTTTLPKWMFFQKLFFKSSMLLNGQFGIQVYPQNRCLLFCLILLLWSEVRSVGKYISEKI